MGKAKAQFFHRMGFRKERAEELRNALLEVARTGEVHSVVSTPYGTKYIVDGELLTPLGRRVNVRTVWIVERGEDIPRFVTAYPREEE